MITAVNSLKVKKGRANEVVDRFKVVKTVHTFEGFISMEVLTKEGTTDFDQVEIHTTWENRSYFDKWNTSKEFKSAHVPVEKMKQTQKDNPIINSNVSFYQVRIQRYPAEKVTK